jgi:cell wall assembly regulator SMI1
MNEVHRIQEAWKRIEQWLSVNFPEALQQLRPPATDREIAAVEAEINLELPEVVKASFKIHDGEDSQFGVLADSFWLMPLNQVIEVDLGCGLCKVIASWFLDFLEQYADDLEAGFYIMDDDYPYH